MSKYGDWTRGEDEALINKLGGLEVARGILRGELLVEVKPKLPPPLLRKVASVAVNGAKKFVARDVLKEANVGWTGDNFKKLFLGNVEEDVADITFAINRLEQSSSDAPIMAQLGDRTEIKLTHFFELLKKQSKGEDGALLTNGNANIAYIRGSDGNLWAVHGGWGSACGYWGVEVYSVEGPSRWSDGFQILSRDS